MDAKDGGPTCQCCLERPAPKTLGLCCCICGYRACADCYQRYSAQQTPDRKMACMRCSADVFPETALTEETPLGSFKPLLKARKSMVKHRTAGYLKRLQRNGSLAKFRLIPALRMYLLRLNNDFSHLRAIRQSLDPQGSDDERMMCQQVQETMEDLVDLIDDTDFILSSYLQGNFLPDPAHLALHGFSVPEDYAQDDLPAVRCANDRCPHGVVGKDGTCFVCAVKTCLLCSEVADPTHQCSEDVRANILLANETSVPCPTCNIRIEKQEGCDSMLCRACGTRFHFRTRIIQARERLADRPAEKTTEDKPLEERLEIASFCLQRMQSLEQRFSSANWSRPARALVLTAVDLCASAAVLLQGLPEPSPVDHLKLLCGMRDPDAFWAERLGDIPEHPTLLALVMEIFVALDSMDLGSAETEPDVPAGRRLLLELLRKYNTACTRCALVCMHKRRPQLAASSFAALAKATTAPVVLFRVASVRRKSKNSLGENHDLQSVWEMVAEHQKLFGKGPLVQCTANQERVLAKMSRKACKGEGVCVLDPEFVQLVGGGLFNGNE